MNATNSFKLTIRTPEEELFKKEVKSIAFNSDGGQMQVFAHHASLTATLSFSTLIMEEGEKEEKFVARKGIFLFNNRKNSALLLALYCEKESEISHQTAKEYLEFIKKELNEGKDLSEFQILYLKGEQFAVEQQVKEKGD